MSFIENANPWIAAAGAVLNPAFAHLTNVKNRKFTREMYNRQRQDALADYQMQNTYNSPRAQMQRFQEAGLNPNLIYGQSNEGATVRSSSSQGGNAEAPQVSNRDISGSLMTGVDISQRSAQTELLAKQMQLMDEDIKLRRTQQWATVSTTGKTDAETKNILFDLGIKSDIRDYTIEGKKWEVEKLKTEQNKLQAEIMMMWQKQPHQVKGLILDNLNKAKQAAKTDAEIKEINSKITLLNQEWRIKKIDEYLAAKNINPKDPFWARSIQDLLSRLFD